MPRASRVPVAVLLAVAALAGCSAEPLPTAPVTPRPTASASSSPTPDPVGAVQPVGDPVDVATGLAAPWSVLPLPGGTTLVSERDTARIVEVGEGGALREAGVISGVVPGGEGGLLGLALLEDGEDDWLYAYFTAQADNRIVRMPLTGQSGAIGLGEQEVVLEGIAKASNHDGGRIAFGPDGMLYATTGDASQPASAQDPLSLNGKILRMTPTGDVPDDNPFDDSLTWSLGHRNPQGLAWTEDGVMFAAEFGQNTWDEVNRIEPGANYGWPVVEGAAGQAGYTDPVAQWSTDDASPSGLAAIGTTLFLAGLGGERVWMLNGAHTGSPDIRSFAEGFGRIRDAIAAPDGSLWLLTNNTDGRGDPRPGDDRLLRVPLGPL